MNLLHVKYCCIVMCLSFSLFLLLGCEKDKEVDECSPNVLKSTSLFLEASTVSPRRSEGDFVLLKNNRILTIYSNYSGMYTLSIPPS